MAEARWLLYALGGGLGHLTRALALGRVARRRGHLVQVVTTSAFAPLLPLEAELGSEGVHRLDAELDREAVRAAIERLLAETRPDVLVVDTFPRGLGGELAALLPHLPARKVLVHRDVSPAYVERFGLARFVDVYDRLLLPGEPAPLAHHPRAVETAPWLLRDAEELLDVPEARRRLRAPEDPALPVVAVLGCGREEEVAQSAMLARRLQHELPEAAVRWLCPMPSPDMARSGRWPALESLRGVDVLVGAGGYNTVQEARATGTPLVAFARERLYDRQALRLRPHERVEDAEALLARVRELLATATPARPAPHYVNGVHAAVDLIEALSRG